MKLHDHFKTFLDEYVNLNATRLSLLENSIGAIRPSIIGPKEGLHK